MLECVCLLIILYELPNLEKDLPMKELFMATLLAIVVAVFVFEVLQHKTPAVNPPYQEQLLLRKQAIDMMKYHLDQAIKYKDSTEPTDKALKQMHIELSQYYSKLYLKQTALMDMHLKVSTPTNFYP